MTAVIIEDEIPASIRLTRMLEQKGFTIVNHLQSVRKAVHWFESNSHPEVVFMDIKLSDGDSFAIFDKIKIQSKVVFTTAYDDYALKAFENKGVAYLLKPVDEKKLDVLMDNLEFYKSVFNETISLSDVKSYTNHFVVSFGSTLKRVSTENIIAFYSENNATFILSTENRSYMISKSLEKLEVELNPTDFFRINRKVIINKKHIQSVKNFNVVIDENPIMLELKISRTRQTSFKEWYK